MENTTKKITKRENIESLLALLDVAEEKGIENFDYDVLRVYCENEIVLLEKKANAAKIRAEKARVEGDELRDRIFELIPTDDFITIPAIEKALNNEDITPQKITSRLGQLVKLNKVERGTVTIEATETTKARKITGYRAL